jgi:hypothetical protein
MNCRCCGAVLTHVFADLVNAPPSNAFLTADQLAEPEVFYPLTLFVCDTCFLVQIGEHRKSSDIFNSAYAYYSSFSKTWLSHAEQYVEMMMRRFGYGRTSQVVEIASNDGYLLQYFDTKGIPVLGIEPAGGPAAAARDRGIETVTEFFGERLARRLVDQGRAADLLIGNNVLAHVPDLHDFVTGLTIALKPGGTITLEFPHLMRLVDDCLFDTIYHEHFSYFSLSTVTRLFRDHDLTVFDVEEIPTHGGSARLYVRHAQERGPVSGNVAALLSAERAKGMDRTGYYAGFQARVDRIKNSLLRFLIEQKNGGRGVAAYGAAAKGNTLINYCGIKKDLLAFVADASPHKQGRYLPGSHIPVVPEDEIKRFQPDYVLVLPWNIKNEIIAQLAYIRSWNGRFVLSNPDISVV